MIVALDLETTGLDNKLDKIIELALIKFDENTGEIVDEYCTLINPGISIPPLNSVITNITDEDVADAPKWTEIREKVENFIGDFPILGHNTIFDRDFLIKNQVDIVDNIMLDTFHLANFLLRYNSSLSLESLIKDLSLGEYDAHRAREDTLITIKLFEKLTYNIKDLDKSDKEIINYFFSRSTEKDIIYLREYLFSGENLKLLDIDDIINNSLAKIGKYKKKAKKKREKIDKEDLKLKDIIFDEKYFKDFEGFEHRQNQSYMSTLVSEALLSDKKKVIEAPTGVGKTFAYLLPSISYSIDTGEQVFISTNTKILQDQIIDKDLSYLSKNLDFDYTKLKGKRNYLGLRTFFDFLLEETNLKRNKLFFLLKIILWLGDTKNGELDELNFFGDEYYYLPYINADNYIVSQDDDNPYKKYEFIHKARQKALTSDIVIINHAILLQDISLDNSILGEVKNLVIDEAHKLEDVSTDALKKGFNVNKMIENFTNIEKILKKHKENVSDINKIRDILFFDLSIILDGFKSYIFTKNTNNYNKSYLEELIREDFYTDIDKLLEFKIKVKGNILSIVDILSIMPEKIYIELKNYIGYLEDVVNILEKFLDKNSIEDYICIANYGENTGISLNYTYLRPGEYIEKNLWSKLDTCILTSATLNIGDNFDYISNIMNLKDFEFETIDTDFDYSTQALLFIPNDLGNIKTNISNILIFFREFFEVVRGNTLLLFTAFSTIKETYLYLSPYLRGKTNIYAQGMGGGKNKIIDFFKSDPDNSILIGTDSFWEGVDIRGDDLKYLIIHKFPFMVPTDPIFKARSRIFDDSFREYSIPKAILKLKQGFGRLIRSKNDKGVIILLDDRINSTAWGDIMYNSFPKDIKVKKGSSKQFLEILKKI